MPWWFVITLLGRDVVLAATLPLLRSRGLTALPVTYIGKARDVRADVGFPLVLLGQWDALWSRVVAGVRVGIPDLGAVRCICGRSCSTCVQVALVMRRMPKVHSGGDHGAARPATDNRSRPADDIG